ncbi:MAG: hypothetical protein ABSG62_21010, partial [Terracidiphilus sp.]
MYSQTAWICSGVACAFMTTNMDDPSSHQSIVWQGEGQFFQWESGPHALARSLGLKINSTARRRIGGRTLRRPEPRQSVVESVGGFGARPGGNDRGGNNQTDKDQGNQEVMHFLVSLSGSLELVRIWIIGGFGRNLNST